MGRVSTGDSSLSSVESSFREFDEIFLQNQTIIWIGEILKTRLNEEVHISDLLQDGEILYEVSQVIWNLLLTKCKETRDLKHQYDRFGSRKSSGRYRPYSNVDSFIKICKILGMSGVDLFSPSDVVEKRDIRKVCICIRALSKKVKSKLLLVPSFDLVMPSVPMPKDMVGGIRRSLESSHCTSSSSCSSSSYKSSQKNHKKRNMRTPTDRDDGSSCDESDEAESSYTGVGPLSLSRKFDDNYSTGVNSEQEDSPEAYSKHVKLNNMAFLNLKKSDSVVESNYISDYLAFSDLMVHKADDGKGENSNMFDFFVNGDSQGITNSDFHENDDDVSSTTSLSSVFGRMLSFEFDDPFDVADESSIIEHETEKPHPINDGSYNCADLSNPEYELFCQNADELVDEDNNHKIPFPLLEDNKYNDLFVLDDNIDRYVSVGEVNEHENVEEMKIDAIQDEIISSAVENVSQNIKQALLKTVLKSTAIAGILFLLLHIRKRRGNNSAQQTKKDMHKEANFKKQLKESRGKSVYPVERFKF